MSLSQNNLELCVNGDALLPLTEAIMASSNLETRLVFFTHLYTWNTNVSIAVKQIILKYV